MADVAPWGWGDGAGDPPPTSGFFRGMHETDAVPPKRVRGKAKNEKLRRLVKGGGVSLTFDRQVTYTPFGRPRDMFSREAGMYMWRTIPFEKVGWDNVSPPHRKISTLMKWT
ncbi:hypothetical protein HanHA300_Chr05g0178111 [Helianthus annuus]|nr:hypothetical protein HanHA300_Chr05g0178111 [Helianthus annuus]